MGLFGKKKSNLDAILNPDKKKKAPREQKPDKNGFLFGYPNGDVTKPFSLLKYTGAATAVSVPSVYDGETVTAIGELAFCENETLQRVVLADTITTIGMDAFCDCTALSAITMPGVTNIESDAFAGCTSLDHIVLSDEVTYVGSCAFVESALDENHRYGNAYYVGNDENPNLVLIGGIHCEDPACRVEDGTVVIAERAFWYMEHKHLFLPYSVRYICDEAIKADNIHIESLPLWCSIHREDCSILRPYDLWIEDEKYTTLEIPEDITYIAPYTFRNAKLTEISFAEPDGWYCDGEPIDVSDPAENARLLTDEELDGQLWERY